MGVTILTGDQRTKEAKHWPTWLGKVPEVRRRFHAWSDDFDPFHYNETSSVAALANAATLAGFVAQTEYVLDKRHTTRGRAWRRGRGDLWLADNQSGCCWVFEAKQHFAATQIRASTFDQHLQRACRDARGIDRDEADQRVGFLIVVPRTDARLDDLGPRMDELAMRSDFAFRIDGALGPIWLALNIVG